MVQWSVENSNNAPEKREIDSILTSIQDVINQYI